MSGSASSERASPLRVKATMNASFPKTTCPACARGGTDPKPTTGQEGLQDRLHANRAFVKASEFAGALICRRQAANGEFDDVARPFEPAFDFRPVGLLRPAFEPFARLVAGVAARQHERFPQEAVAGHALAIRARSLQALLQAIERRSSGRRHRRNP